MRGTRKNPFLNMFSPCSGGEMPDLSHVKKALNKAVQGNLEGASDTILLGCEGGEGDDVVTPVVSTEDHELQQIRRLGSWGTIGTFGTLGTNPSFGDTIPDDVVTFQFDDDGNPVNRRVLQKAKQKRTRPRRLRLVQFDYPPISSLKQCPRVHPDELPGLFFTEEELDQYEDDRRSTFTVDDVEVVAVSSSSASDDDTPPAAPPSDAPFEDAPPTPRGFSNYASTPRRGRSREATGGPKRRRRRRRATPAPPRQRCHQEHPSDEDNLDTAKEPHRDKRLLKSVQIFLRERSTGM
jgi:hypothetical protein